MLRRLALAGMGALLVGAAPLAQTPEPAQDDSIEAFRTGANAGDADAQVLLGFSYANGLGVPKDFVKTTRCHDTLTISFPSRGTMVLSKSEFIASLQNEVRILLHLATKIDRSMLDYRPTPKQRSTLELLRYLSMMGPMMIRYCLAKDGEFDRDAWMAEAKAAEARDFDQTLATIAAHPEEYAKLLWKIDRSTEAKKLEAHAKVIRAMHAKKNPAK